MRKLILLSTGLLLTLALLIGCGGGKKSLVLPADQQFAKGKEKFDKKKYISAIEEFQKVIFNYPGATMVDSALYYLAMSYYGNKEYELAAVEFKRLGASYPQSDFVDEAQYMAALSYLENSPKNYGLDQEDLRKSISLMQEFIIDNPDSPLVEDARREILNSRTKLARKDYENAILYYKMYDYRAAEIYFQNVIDSYTDTEYAAMSLYKLGEMSYKLKKYEEALTRFNNFVTIYPSNELVPKANEYIQKLNTIVETESSTDGS